MLHVGSPETDLQCLGSWVGEDGKNYLAVRDARINDGDPEPQYRCGVSIPWPSEPRPAILPGTLLNYFRCGSKSCSSLSAGKSFAVSRFELIKTVVFRRITPLVLAVI